MNRNGICLLSLLLIPWLVVIAAAEVIPVDDEDSVVGIVRQNERLDIPLLTVAEKPMALDPRPVVEVTCDTVGTPPAWATGSYNMGATTADNDYVSYSRSAGYQYLVSQLSPNTIYVLQSSSGDSWTMAKIDMGDTIGQVDIDVDPQQGYIYISFIYSGNLNPGIIRSLAPDDITAWDAGYYWGQNSCSFISVGASDTSRVCIGYDEGGDLHFRHTFSYPGTWQYTVGYDPIPAQQSRMEIDAARFDGSSSLIYSASQYIDPVLTIECGAITVYQQTATAMSGQYYNQWIGSGAAANDDLTIDGSDDKFTIAVNYLTDSWKIWARTYENWGNSFFELGHAASSTNQEYYPRIFHDPIDDYKYIAYFNSGTINKVCLSVNNGNGSWTLSEQEIPDSQTPDMSYAREVCVGFIPYAGRMMVAWIDTRDSFNNVYLNMNPDACAEGVHLEMPNHTYTAGDTCYLKALACHGGSSAQPNTPVFVFLDIGIGEYWFAPSWSHWPPTVDYYPMTLQPGPNSVLPDPIAAFTWPAGAGSGGTFFFHGGMTDSAMTTVVGNVDSWSFTYN